MDTSPLKKLQEVLHILAELECTVSDFYKICAEKWQEDKTFWMDMQIQELQHAQRIERMSEIISQNPEKFTPGKNFNPMAIKTVLAGITNNIKLIQHNKLSKIQTLYLAGDLEKSMLENKTVEIVKTKDLGFLELAGEITLQTEKHRDQLNSKIIAMESKVGQGARE